MNFENMWSIMHGHSDLVYVCETCLLLKYYSDYPLAQILGNRLSSHGDRHSCLLVWRCRQNGALRQEEDTRITGRTGVRLELPVERPMADQQVV
jgi:hypothetical protein